MAGGTKTSGFRLRRTHEKSKTGCLRCKQQRKKCDELRPRCSRCTKRMYTCRYESSFNEQGSTQLPIPGSAVSIPLPRVGFSDSVSPLTHSSDHSSVSSPSSGGQLSSSSSLSLDPNRLSFDSNTFSTLDTVELDLLSHYLTHTSRTIPADELDLYALSVGVPNLAFNSEVVMSSLLALAAACKSHDIVKRAQSPLSSQKLIEIQHLLSLAERHHQASLRHIQATMQNPDSYDHILANAALMVLYASASHSIRVYLAAAAKKYGQRLPHAVLPQHSQWMSFTRAAHTASTAVLNRFLSAAVESSGPASGAFDGQLQFENSVLGSADDLLPENGPTEHTERLFLPLVASTYQKALARLYARMESISSILKISGMSVTENLQLQACWETVSVLETCACTALSTKQSESVEYSKRRPTPSAELSKVSPWVAWYMISVTSMESPQILRRIVMSFLNKAPTEYLNLVQSVLDSPASETRAEKWRSRDSPAMEVPLLDVLHLLAMDIFGHWLVLVMLLDGVWWIGDIGKWELGQVVSLMKTQNLPNPAADVEEAWWPETMYLVKQELTASA